jgi:large conductance mechanosensitive channel
MIKEFLQFLKQYGVIGLAIAVVIGGKVNDFVSATVTDILMPIIGVILPEGGWEHWVLNIGPLHFPLGHWLGVAIDFIIVAFFVFMIAKLVLKERNLEEKFAVKKGDVDSWKEVSKSAQGTTQP